MRGGDSDIPGKMGLPPKTRQSFSLQAKPYCTAPFFASIRSHILQK